MTTRSSNRAVLMALEYTAEGPRPLLNVTLIVRAFPVFLQVTNDATGRHSLAAVPLNNGGRSVNVSIAPAPGSGDYAPCPSGSDSVTSDTTFGVGRAAFHRRSAVHAAVAGEHLGLGHGVREYAARDPANRWRVGALGRRWPGGGRKRPAVQFQHADGCSWAYLLCPPLPGTGTDTYAPVRVKREGYQPASRQPTFVGTIGVSISSLFGIDDVP
jgi:hypothetical protein